MPPAEVFKSRKCRLLYPLFDLEVFVLVAFGALFGSEARYEGGVVIAHLVHRCPKAVLKSCAQFFAIGRFGGQDLPHSFFGLFDLCVVDFALGGHSEDQFAIVQFGTFDIERLGYFAWKQGLNGFDFGQQFFGWRDA